MTSLSLFEALTMIRDGCNAKTIEQIRHLRVQSPTDINTNFVFAHALEVSKDHSRANSVWETVSNLQSKQRPSPPPTSESKSPAFTFTESLQQELDKIFSSDDGDEIQGIIEQLNSSDRKAFHEASNIDDDLDDELLEDEYDHTAPTETFARILANQKEYAKAAEAYRSLSEQNPLEKGRLLSEARRLEELAAQHPNS